KGLTVAIFGTGPVGLCTAIIAAQEGASTRLCGLTADDDKNVAMRFCDRYDVSVDWVSALTSEEKIVALNNVDVVICVAKAGVRILEQKELDSVSNLLVVADTNAVPPSGAAGVGMQDLDTSIEYAGGVFSGIGPLAIGNIKSQTEIGLFKYVQESEKAALIDFPDAYKFALSLVNK
ncbi:MAG: methylenetetrahydromethanopterin dehydrogenase, partial [Methylococcaceae bacterium]